MAGLAGYGGWLVGRAAHPSRTSLFALLANSPVLAGLASGPSCAAQPAQLDEQPENP